MSGQYSDRMTLEKDKKAVKTDDETDKSTPENNECDQPKIKPVIEDIPKKVKVSARVEANQETEINIVEDVSSDDDTITQIPSYYSGRAFGQIQEQHIFIPLAKKAEIIDKPRVYYTLLFDLEELLTQHNFAKFLILMIYIMDSKYRMKITMLERIRLFRKFVTNSMFFLMCLNIALILFLAFYIAYFPLNKPKPEPYWKELMRQLY